MDAKHVVAALAALAHEHRLAVYRLLVEAGPGGLPAGVIAERLGVAPSSLSFHTKGLVQAGLATKRRASRRLIYAADFSVMNALVGYLTDNCCAGNACGTPESAPCTPAAPRAAADEGAA